MIIAVIVLICLIPLGVRAVYNSDGFRLWLLVGPVKIVLFPKPKKAKQEKEAPQKENVFASEQVKVAKKVEIKSDAVAKKPLKVWSEVVQSIESIDKGAYAFLKKTRAYVSDDGKIHVLYDGFGLFAIDKPELKKALASSISGYMGSIFTENDIIYEQDSGKIRLEDDNSDLDAFNDFFDNN